MRILNVIQIILLIKTATAKRLCHICGKEGNKDITFPTLVLSGIGKTCSQLAVEVAIRNTHNSTKCKSETEKYQKRCCRLKKEPPGHPAIVEAPTLPVTRYVGPHKECSICRDGDYPFKTSMVVNMLYMGAASCKQYYKYGKEGRIPRHLCSAVHYFFYEPCGCGKYNPFAKYYLT